MKSMNENVIHTSEEEYHTIRQKEEDICVYRKNGLCTNAWQSVMHCDLPMEIYCLGKCDYREVKKNDEKTR